MILSKNDSNYLKGIAMILMMLVHLFAFPERIWNSENIIYILSDFHFERYLGIFGGICVPMFLFLSAYGFSISGVKKTKYYFSKIFSFYQSYWLVFVIFIPIGLVFYDTDIWYGNYIRYTFDIKSLIANFFALSNSYNGEWWFVELYLLLVLIVPVINKLRLKPILMLFTSFVFFVFCWILKKSNIDTPLISIVNLLYWQPIFICGYVLGTVKDNKKVSDVLSFIKKYSFYISILSFFIAPILVFFLRGVGAMIATPLFIVFLLETKRYIPKAIEKMIISTGIYSIFMWLTHSFYCYYFAAPYIYSPKYTVLIFINLYIVTFITAFILNKLNVKLHWLLQSMFTRFELKAS